MNYWQDLKYWYHHSRYLKALKVCFASLYLRWQVRKSIEVISGDADFIYGPDELIVLTLLKNAELHIKSFLNHYLSLGVKKIVLLDNGSTDRTIELASSYPNVVILSSELPFKTYQILLRQYLIHRFCKNRWCLYVDSDELFDYPYSEHLSISKLLDYLNVQGYTAVVAQMLDMFSDRPISQNHDSPEDSLKEKYPYYDISAVHKKDYKEENDNFSKRSLSHVKNRISNPAIKWHVRGIRGAVFGHQDLWLTKHPLFFCGEKMPLIHQHWTRGTRIADFSCVLFHYKFLSNFFNRTLDAIQQGQYGTSSYDYRMYYGILKERPNLGFQKESSSFYKDMDQLVSSDFVVVSKQYQDYVGGTS
ncbi:MAG: glycosyltransferase family 2 protein [Candidatus Omnitrophica bacterium]|nr:glycosyltransferase family 2 protein [Candidatus Omnitrophota bacterium]